MEDVHPVITLLVKRMESNPEEFFDSSYGANLAIQDATLSGRWSVYLYAIKDYGSQADKAAIQAALGKMNMERIHELVVEELLNGTERRAERDKQRAIIAAQAAQAKSYATQAQLSQYAAQAQGLTTAAMQGVAPLGSLLGSNSKRTGK